MHLRIIGARLLFVLLDIPTYFTNPIEIINLRDGGLSYQGGFIAALLVGIASHAVQGLTAGYWQISLPPLW